MDYTGGTFDTLRDDRPMNESPEKVVLIAVDYLSEPPTATHLQEAKMALVKQGWKSLSAHESYQITGHPYRVEYWGHK